MSNRLDVGETLRSDGKFPTTFCGFRGENARLDVMDEALERVRQPACRRGWLCGVNCVLVHCRGVPLAALDGIGEDS